MDILGDILGSVGLLTLILVWLSVLAAAVLRSFTGFGFGRPCRFSPC